MLPAALARVHSEPILGLVVATLVASCRAAPDPEAALPPSPADAGTAAASASKPTPALLITVVEDPAADRWTVEYRFERPTMGVRFARHKERQRSARWAASADGGAKPIDWSHVGKHEFSRLRGRAPAQTITLSLASDSAATAGDYEQNANFTDGSRLLYTGHFAVQPLECPDAAPCEAADAVERTLSPSDVRWRFRTAADRHVVVLDARAKGELEWSSPMQEIAHGTYAYFGNIAPLETEVVRAIVDPGLPPWMLSATHELVPKLVEWFGKDTRTPLSFRPVVFLSFGGMESPGRSYGGGGLPGMTELRASGVGWRDETPDSRAAWLTFIAHELFHSWNGGLFDRRNPRAEFWLSEGSSDLFAYRAARALGAIDDTAYRTWLVRAANRCLLTLQRRPLAGDDWGMRTDYSCGASLLAWIDGMARSREQTIGTVFGRLFEEAARRGDHKYGADDMMEEITRLTGDPNATEPFDRVLHKGLTERADEMFSAQLKAAGVETKLVRVREAELDSGELPRIVARELARCDCGRRMSVQLTHDGIEFNAVPECNVLAGVRVVAVEGHAVPRDYLGALEALVTRDGSKPIMVRVADRKAPVPIKCRSDAQPPTFKRLLR